MPSDRLVSLGGTVILSETPEIYGAEHLLYARAPLSRRSPTSCARGIDWWEHYTKLNGAEMNNNPSPGNKAGGLTTILEKSLGAVAKAGTSPLNDVIEYAAAVHRTRAGVHGQPRLRSLQRDRPGGFRRHHDRVHHRTRLGVWLQALALDQALVQFRNLRRACATTSISIAERSPRGEATIEQKGEEILTYLLEVASGRKSKSEELGYGGVEFVPWQVGAVM